jgi:hypothetical protein
MKRRSSIWLKTLLALVASVLLAALILAAQPVDLSHVQRQRTTKGSGIGDLPSAIEQTAIKQSGPLRLSEGDLNAQLAKHLPPTRTAPANEPREVLIDLQPEQARVHLTWVIGGHPLTASVDIALRRSDQHFDIEVLRGSYGRLSVPRALLPPLVPTLRALQRTCDAEITALLKIPRPKISENILELDPKF